MSSKQLAILGIVAAILEIVACVLSFASSAEEAPAVLLMISLILMLIFRIMAIIWLWKPQKVVAVLFLASPLASSLLPFIYPLFKVQIYPLILLEIIVKIIDLVLFIMVISYLLTMGRRESLAKIPQDSRLTDEEFSSVQRDTQKENYQEAVQKNTIGQVQYRVIFDDGTVVDAKDTVSEIGKIIPWSMIVKHTFRVLDFDRNGTIIDKNVQVKAKSRTQPYGYLLVESPVLNNRAKLPIVHQVDFLLVSSVFDDPYLLDMLKENELLVTYAPNSPGTNGVSVLPFHVLHYMITPRGTLDAYYSKNNGMYMVKPDPERLFGKFVYVFSSFDQIKVNINPNPKF